MSLFHHSEKQTTNEQSKCFTIRYAPSSDILVLLSQSFRASDSPQFVMTVRRGHVLKDCLHVMAAAPDHIKHQPLCVRFVNESSASTEDKEALSGGVRELSTLLGHELMHSALVKG